MILIVLIINLFYNIFEQLISNYHYPEITAVPMIHKLVIDFYITGYQLFK